MLIPASMARKMISGEATSTIEICEDLKNYVDSSVNIINEEIKYAVSLRKTSLTTKQSFQLANMRKCGPDVANTLNILHISLLERFHYHGYACYITRFYPQEYARIDSDPRTNTTDYVSWTFDISW